MFHYDKMIGLVNKDEHNYRKPVISHNLNVLKYNSIKYYIIYDTIVL